MNLEPQIKDPIAFRLSHHECTILGDDNIEDLPLTPGAMFGGDHYGFTVIVDSDGKQTETTYPTQCRLISAEVKDEVLSISEENKYASWQIDKKGNVIRPAQFLKQWRPNVDFLSDQGIKGETAIDEVNQLSYKRR